MPVYWNSESLYFSYKVQTRGAHTHTITKVFFTPATVRTLYGEWLVAVFTWPSLVLPQDYKTSGFVLNEAGLIVASHDMPEKIYAICNTIYQYLVDNSSNT